MKNLEKFFRSYGKFMAASSLALKPSSGSELTIMLDLLKNDSQK